MKIKNCILKEEEILALLRLQKTPMIGDIVAKKLIAHVGYANDIFKEKKQILQKINGIGKLTVQNLFEILKLKTFLKKFPHSIILL